ncbi:MAG: 2-phospho-L-lactate guanylyltransferase [Nocardioides sp.]|nr:2-phospho-L-lactate guanylyltransferase [Nocardioides sp.]
MSAPLAPDPGPPPAGFLVLLPVKPPALGKSRLVGLGHDERRLLARAFALDTAQAALAAHHVAGVLVATDDAAFSAELTALGCVAIPDGVSLDLNGTLRQAAAEAARRWPGLVPVALCADLPALRAVDLDEALGEVAEAIAAGTPASFVADTEGVGTTLYTAPYDAFDPHFGLESAAVHQARGARPVQAAAPTLRRDGDDLDDLAGARAHGGGPCTAALTGR